MTDRRTPADELLNPNAYPGRDVELDEHGERLRQSIARRRALRDWDGSDMNSVDRWRESK